MQHSAAPGMQAPPGPIREARRGCGQALVEQWIDFTTTELDAPLLSWILPILGHWPYDKKARPAPGVV